MKNKLFLLGMIISLIFGILVTGCSLDGGVVSGPTFSGDSGDNKNFYDVKFIVLSDKPGSHIIIEYEYPKNYKYSGPASMEKKSLTTTSGKWEREAAVMKAASSGGVCLRAGSSNTDCTITVEIYIDGKKKASNSGQGIGPDLYNISTSWK